MFEKILDILLWTLVCVVIACVVLLAARFTLAVFMPVLQATFGVVLRGVGTLFYFPINVLMAFAANGPSVATVTLVAIIIAVILHYSGLKEAK